MTDVEVVVTDRAPELSGTVVDDRGRPIVGATVVVFSTERQRWYPVSRYLRRVSTGQDGTFRAAGLPAGPYFAAVAVVPSDDDDVWQDPQFLESLVSGAATVTAVEGLKATLALHSRGR